MGYHSVIEDVCKKVASDFEHESVPDSTLHELKKLWEEKLQNSGVLPHTMNPMIYTPNFSDYRRPQQVLGGASYSAPQYMPAWQKRPPQADGPLDDDLEGLLPLTEDALKGGSDDEEDPGDVESLNSDLDDDAEEPQTDDIVFCQFEKVSRVKTKHKCALKDGIMNLNGRDYLFSKATCEFEFYY